MNGQSILSHEQVRLKRLHEYKILDTLPEQEFDDFTKIASQICEAPIALISLIDEERQWFKAKTGLRASETPRDHAFCDHAIREPNQLLEIPDARKDPRFAHNPLVLGEPPVIFYAGAPLVTPDGHAIGTLCVIDHKPRSISSEAKDALCLLSKQIVNKLELRKKNRELASIAKKLSAEVGRRKAREAELIRAEQAKDQFLSNMSHEIRTPLSGIIGLTQLLQDERDLPPASANLVQHIDFSANHLLRLINDILDFAKVRQNRLTFEDQDFQLPDLLESIGHIMRANAAQKGLTFELKQDPAIPATLRGDASRLGQVLWNLVGNALKFTEKGSICLSVRLAEETEKDVRLTFAVQDTGIGIAPESQERIFEQFAQSDVSISRRFGGTGLGLAISRSLVRQFGGDVALTSELGVGSTFTFDVQLEKVNSKLQEIKAYLHQEKQATRPLKILVAEDTPVNQIITRRHLEKLGFQVQVVDNGQKALDALASDSYDLVLMDIHMPILNGLEATRKIRKSPAPYRDIKIVAVTASVFDSEIRKYLDAGMDGYLSKPFKPQHLYQKIMDLTAERSMASEDHRSPVEASPSRVPRV